MYAIKSDFHHLENEASRTSLECPATVVESPEVLDIELVSVSTLEEFLQYVRRICGPMYILDDQEKSLQR